MGYQDKIKEFLIEYCDLFFINSEDMWKKYPDSTMMIYRNLFFYACKKKFPVISSTNVGKMFGKNSDAVYEGLSIIYSLKENKDETTLKRLEALKKIL